MALGQLQRCHTFRDGAREVDGSGNPKGDRLGNETLAVECGWPGWSVALRRMTDREREIMRLLARGESTKQIAQRLSISPTTVDNHRASILEKMKVDNPTQLAHLVALFE